MLDAVRAARALPHTSLTAASRVGLYGYSEGGGAGASAAELQPTYAPDVPLAGTYSGAPPANLTAVMKGIDGSALVSALGDHVQLLDDALPALIEPSGGPPTGQAAWEASSSLYCSAAMARSSSERPKAVPYTLTIGCWMSNWHSRRVACQLLRSVSMVALLAPSGV